jgi:hypothetical protein
MTVLEITLTSILYVMCALFVGYKQYKSDAFDFDNEKEGSTVLGLIWPITLMVYLLRRLFGSWKF